MTYRRRRGNPGPAPGIVHCGARRLGVDVKTTGYFFRVKIMGFAIQQSSRTLSLHHHFEEGDIDSVALEGHTQQTSLSVQAAVGDPAG